MKKLSTLFCIILCAATLFAQQEEIKFVGHNLNDNKYIQLSKIEITNLTRDWTETLTYPDTTLILRIGSGIEEQTNHAFGLKQNNPNPFVGTTDVTLEVAKAGKVTMDITDILGRKVKSLAVTINTPGTHLFRVNASSTGTYVLTARQNDKVSSIKMINHGIGNSDNITYIGASANLTVYYRGSKGSINQPFFYGDQMQYKGFAMVNNEEVDGELVWKEETVSETIVLPINPNFEDFVCGVSAVTDIDGNIYNTVLLDRQCWMKENLRVSRFPNGTIIPLSTEMSATTPMRYLADNDETQVDFFGYLYNWSAIMNKRNPSNKVPSGVQGICPAGWHIPSEQEFLNMYDYVASVSDYLCEDPIDTLHANLAIAKALASKNGWGPDQALDACSASRYPEDNDATGLSLVPAGCFYNTPLNAHSAVYVWTTTENTESWQDDAVNQFFDWGLVFPDNTSGMKDAGYSARCLRDY